MPDPRLQKVYDAAARLFINQGYSRTQIQPIAKAAGISVGAIYTLFTGKKAILDFLFKTTLDPAFPETIEKLPVTESHFAGLGEEIMAAFGESNAAFGSRLASSAEAYPFPQMLSDAFDVTARYATGCLLFEKNPNDCGELFRAYTAYRKKFIETFAQYVSRYQDQGAVRKLDHPEESVSLMIETIAWWAMHVRYDAFEVRRDIPLSVAKAVCLDALTHAYLA